MEKVKRTWKLFSHRRFVRAFHVVLIRKFSVNNWHSPRSWLAVEECLRANRCDSVLDSPSGSATEERSDKNEIKVVNKCGTSEPRAATTIGGCNALSHMFQFNSVSRNLRESIFHVIPHSRCSQINMINAQRGLYLNRHAAV